MTREFQLTYLLSFTGMLAVCTAMPEKAEAQGMTEHPTINRMALAQPFVGPIEDPPIAMLTRDRQGTDRLGGRVFNHQTGRREGADLTINLTDLMEEEGLAPAHPADLIFSTVFRPGNVLVLDALSRIHEFPLAFDANGNPKLAGPPVLNTVLADPILGDDYCVQLAEVPNAADPKHPFIAIGTNRGNIKCGNNLRETAVIKISDVTIEMCRALPQVGYFALVAVTGGHLVGVNPDVCPSDPGLTPAVTFDLTPARHGSVDPGRAISISNSAAFEPNSPPLISETAIPLVGTDGVRILSITIPPGPETKSDFPTETIKFAPTRLSQVQLGFSTQGDCPAATLAADGAGVLWTANFIEQDPIIPIAGASLTCIPRVLNSNSQGKTMNGYFEIENDGVLDLKRYDMTLTVNGVVIPHTSANFGDVNGDGIADLSFKMDRQAVINALGGSKEGFFDINVELTVNGIVVGRASALCKGTH